MRTKLVFDGLCDQGLKRKINQDASIICSDGEVGLFLVADGMGGHSDGERASGEIKNACRRWWEDFSSEARIPDFQDNVNSLKKMLAAGSRRIWDDTPEGDICGTTIVLMWIQEENYALIWSGDSRCYQVRKNLLGCKVRQMTVDDVWENRPDMVEGLTREEIEAHRNYGKLVQAAGVQDSFECNVLTGPVKRNTLFALCSDGVYKYIGEGNLEQALTDCLKSGDLAGCLRNIRETVYNNQAPDNLTCVLIKLEK